MVESEQGVVAISEHMPTTVEEISSSWLTDQLRTSGLITNGEVSAISHSQVGQGVGLMCLLHQLELDYEGSEVQAPRSLIAKTAVSDLATREMARTFKFYENEVNFYRTAANISPMRTPRCIAVEHDKATDDFILILEDLSDCSTYSQVDGCPPEIAKTAIAALAKHHAAFWETSLFGSQLEWVPKGWEPPIPQSIQEGVRGGLDNFINSFRDHLDEHIISLCSRFPDVATELVDFSGRPLTFVHGDFHVGNLFFTDDEVIAFDWQFPLHTVGAYDLGYFISQNLTVEDRRECEEDLIGIYHDSLVRNGIEYRREQLLEDYERVLLICLMPQILAGGGMELANDEAKKLVIERLNRVTSAIHDHGAGSWMP